MIRTNEASRTDLSPDRGNCDASIFENEVIKLTVDFMTSTCANC